MRGTPCSLRRRSQSETAARATSFSWCGGGRGRAETVLSQRLCGARIRNRSVGRANTRDIHVHNNRETCGMHICRSYLQARLVNARAFQLLHERHDDLEQCSKHIEPTAVRVLLVHHRQGVTCQHTITERLKH